MQSNITRVILYFHDLLIKSEEVLVTDKAIYFKTVIKKSIRN